MERHLELVIERNKTINLTRILDPQEALFLHIMDSLLLKKALDKCPEGPFVDIGTGAGYPGIPLAIATGRDACLVDSVGKKIAALSDFISELGMDGQVHAESCRIEDLGRRERGRYSAAVARAVAPAGVIIEYAAPLLKKGGRVLIAKARPSDEEIETARSVAKICGLTNVSRETFELPHELGHREVLVYERVGNPRIKLPREVGRARHQPLG
jgi:16S rRNA (guanine527-N7)-methyltransferase